MKKVYLLFALAVIGLVACQKDEVDEGLDIAKDGAVLKIKLDLSGATVTSRAIEGEHTGGTVTPVVNSATLYAYNEFGVKTEIDITDATALTNLKNGNEFEVGLPAGTKSIDIVLNNPAGKYTDYSDNINYFNHKKGEGDWLNNTNNYVGADNFERVFLTTENYATKKGLLLEGNTTSVSGSDVPTYKLKDKLVLKPYLARFEVTGGIEVSDEVEFVDAAGLKWKKYPTGGTDQLTQDIEATFSLGTSNRDIIKGSDNFYYIPNKYGTAPGTANDAFYNAAGTVAVKWLPNMYYQVDVEEIYVNNIKVRDAEKTPFAMPWPGTDDAANFWPNWYKAYHLEGWHTAGISSNNSFLCMANMWDRIATGTMVNVKEFNIAKPDGTPGNMVMQVIDGKSGVVSGKSEFKNGTRNLGVIAGQAAAYQFYPQASSSTTKDALMSELPHIIVKVKCYASKAAYDAGTPVEGKNFITLKLFASNNADLDNTYIKSFARGKIYRLDLKNLVSLFKGDKPFPGANVPDPSTPVDKDPEMPGSKLVMQIQIMPWETQNMYPVI